MTNTAASQLLASTIELWLERHPARSTMHPGAITDIAREMIAMGVLARTDAGGLTSLAGGSPEDVFEAVRAAGPHRFRAHGEGVAAAPKPIPSGLSPSAKLALANGHEPVRG